MVAPTSQMSCGGRCRPSGRPESGTEELSRASRISSLIGEKETSLAIGANGVTGAEAIVHSFIAAHISGGQSAGSEAPMSICISVTIEATVIPSLAAAPPTCALIVANATTRTLRKVTNIRMGVFLQKARKATSHKLLIDMRRCTFANPIKG